MKPAPKFIGKFSMDDEELEYVPDPTPPLMASGPEFTAYPKTGPTGNKDACWRCKMMVECRRRMTISSVLWLACEIPDELDIAMLVADQFTRREQ